MSKFYITGTKRGLGKALCDKYETVENLQDCDIFINCKHNGFEQIELLYSAAKINKKIINIGSAGSDWLKGHKDYYRYGLEKKTLKDANDQLFYQGVDTCIINFGYFDTPRVEHITKKKMSVDYCLSIIEWILNQPHRIKDITVCP